MTAVLNVCLISTGMTNYPTGPNRTTPHSTSYFLPPTSEQSLILSLTYTLQTHLIIYVPTSIQLWRICFKAYSLLISKVCADGTELRYSEQLWTETTTMSALNYLVNCRRSALIRLNRVQLTLPSTQPRCWAVYMEPAFGTYVFLCLSCPVCIGRPVCIGLSLMCTGKMTYIGVWWSVGSDWVISHTRTCNK